MVGLGRRGNAVAAIVVIVLLVAAAGVISFSRFTAPERIPQSQPVYSEMQNILDRAYMESSDQLLQNAFSNETNIWYCNKPMPPNTTEVGRGLSHYVRTNLRGIEEEDFFSSTDDIEVSDPVITAATQNDVILLNITDLTITINTPDENRTVNMSMQSSTPLKHQDIYRTLHRWMECNAGGISQRLATALNQRPCAFESCCCGSAPLQPPAHDLLREEEGITAAQVAGVLNESVVSLNNLFAGRTCNANPGPNGSIRCFVNMSGTRIHVENEVVTRYTPQPCGNPTCQPRPLFGHDGTVMDWSDEVATTLGETCPNRPALPIDTGIGPDIEPLRPPNQSMPEGGESKHIIVALHKKAAANALITCQVLDHNGLEEMRFSLRVRVREKNVCAVPSLTPSGTSDDMCTGAGGGGACPCPQPSCECGGTPTVCDALCRVKIPGSCDSCGGSGTGEGPGTGPGTGLGTGSGGGDGGGNPDEGGTTEPPVTEPSCTGDRYDQTCGSPPPSPGE